MTEDPHPLDNPIWNALTSCHATLAEGGPHARRYPAAFARFAALAEPGAAAYDALQRLAGEGEELALFTRADLAPPTSWEVALRRDLLQMVRAQPVDPPAAERPTLLGAADVAEMLALVEKTKPGPFYARTHELGRFIGLRIDGRLAAMAGERLHLDGYTEVSAVCTDPAFRGRGLARGLIGSVCQGIAARGELPILHVFADNLPAIALYETLGFETRATLRLTVLRAAGPVG